MQGRFLFLPFFLAASLASIFAGIEPKVHFRFDPNGFRGDSTQLIVNVSLPEGWHIQSYAPLDSFLIPTRVHAEGPGLEFGTPIYPKPVEEDFPALGGKVALFQGSFDIRVPVKKASRKTGVAALKAVKVSLRYQACNNTQCLPPREIVASSDTASKKNP